MRLCFDIDFLVFEAVSVAQEVFITATHTPTGQEIEFENKTALWGDWRKKNGGWIGLQNEMAGEDYYKAEDFVVVDGVRPRPFRIKVLDEDGEETTSFLSPFDGAKKILDDKIKLICKTLGTDDYFGYTGTGEVFRHELATLLPYKGNRADLITPLLLKQMKEYVVEHHNIELVTGIEADDACNIANVFDYKRWKMMDKDDKYKTIQVAVDKDTKGGEGFHFNPNKDTEVREISGFGSLWLTAKGDVDGCGRIWLYWQIAHGDSTDNYVANCFSSVKYAGKGAYNDLKDCKNDKEAFEALVRIFKKLYPEKKTVEGCKGPVEIDHMYVMQEMATMAMMLRHHGDKIDVRAVCDKLGVVYD
jgi:hypothetical protein